MIYYISEKNIQGGYHEMLKNAFEGGFVMWLHSKNHVIDIKTGKPTIDFVFGALEPFHGTWLLTRAKGHELK